MHLDILHMDLVSHPWLYADREGGWAVVRCLQTSKQEAAHIIRGLMDDW